MKWFEYKISVQTELDARNLGTETSFSFYVKSVKIMIKQCEYRRFNSKNLENRK